MVKLDCYGSTVSKLQVSLPCNAVIYKCKSICMIDPSLSVSSKVFSRLLKSNLYFPPFYDSVSGKTNWRESFCTVHLLIKVACIVKKLVMLALSKAANPWTNFSLQDEPWAEFSTFRSGCCMHTMHLLPCVAIQPNLELKTRPKQLLGSLPLVIALLG